MRSLAFILAFISFPVLATCPDLAGSYKVCRSSRYDIVYKNLVVAQKVEDGITTYSMKYFDVPYESNEETEYRADGITVRGGGYDLTISCEEDQLKYEITAYLFRYVARHEVGKISKEGKTLKEEISGWDLDGPYEHTIICE